MVHSRSRPQRHRLYGRFAARRNKEAAHHQDNAGEREGVTPRTFNLTHAADLQRDRRRAFAAPGGVHDRIVRLLSGLLPAAVGVVVAAMVVTPLFPRSEVSFLLDRNRVAITEERLRVVDAVYRGLDTKLRPFSVTAQGAVQHSARVPLVAMDRLNASLQLDDGPARLTAPTGEYDLRNDWMYANGPVNFWGPNGYHMVTTTI